MAYSTVSYGVLVTKIFAIERCTITTIEGASYRSECRNFFKTIRLDFRLDSLIDRFLKRSRVSVNRKICRIWKFLAHCSYCKLNLATSCIFNIKTEKFGRKLYLIQRQRKPQFTCSNNFIRLTKFQNIQSVVGTNEITNELKQAMIINRHVENALSSVTSIPSPIITSFAVAHKRHAYKSAFCRAESVIYGTRTAQITILISSGAIEISSAVKNSLGLMDR